MADKVMNKPDVIRAIASNLDCTQIEAEKHLNAFISVVEGELVEGNSVKVVNFCKFEARKVARTNYTTPDGTEVVKAKNYKPVIKPSKRMKTIME